MKESIASLRKQINKQPHDKAVLAQLADAYREAGKIDQALAAFKKLIDIDPDNYKALNNYGALLRIAGEIKTAANVLRRADALLPNSPIILSNLANAYTGLFRFDLALQACHQAISIQPDFFDAHEALGRTQYVSGNFRDAIDNLNIALKIRPDSISVIGLLAESWHYLGDNEKAYELIKPVLLDESKPEFGSIYFKISDKLGLRDHAVEYILNILKTQKKKSSNFENFHSLFFCLGKHYDQHMHYEEAFSYYYQANKLCNRNYDINATIKQFDNIIASFPKVPINPDTASNTSNQPVFILGMPRSGTSLVEQILSSHSQVFGAGELTNIDIAAQTSEEHNKNKNPNKILGSIDSPELDSIASNYLQHINEISNNAAKVIDKMPHNFMHIGFILRLFPSATIINCTRHPLDSCLSCYFSEFGTRGHEYSYNLSAAANYYLQYNRLMSHWYELYGDRILQVKYEDLIMDHEGTCRKLIQYCELDWEDQCLEFHKNKKQTLTLSYEQVNKPIYTKSMFRWKNYDKHLGKPKKILSEVTKFYEDSLNHC